MDNKDINQLQENLDNLNINIMNKIDEEKEENDISNIIKTKKKIQIIKSQMRKIMK